MTTTPTTPYGITWANRDHSVAQTGHVFSAVAEARAVAVLGPVRAEKIGYAVDGMCDHHGYECGVPYGRVESEDESFAEEVDVVPPIPARSTHPGACPHCGGTVVNYVQSDYLLREAELRSDDAGPFYVIGDTLMSEDNPASDLFHCHTCQSEYPVPAGLREVFDEHHSTTYPSATAEELNRNHLGHKVTWVAVGAHDPLMTAAVEAVKAARKRFPTPSDGAADRYAADLFQEFLEDPRYGHCDTCGAMCDKHGCTTDRTHVAAIPG